MHYHLAVFPSLPVPWLAGQPTFVFVTVNEAQRSFATFLQVHTALVDEETVSSVTDNHPKEKSDKKDDCEPEHIQFRKEQTCEATIILRGVLVKLTVTADC
jgi:hypothetical protein